LSLLGKRPDERPFDVGVFKSALDQCIASDLTADEQEQEPEASALSDDFSPRPAQFMDGLSALTQMPAEEDTSRHCAAPEESSTGNVDDSEFGAGRAAGVDAFQDPHASYEPRLTEDNSFTDLSEMERERIIEEQVAIDDWKQALQENEGRGEIGLELAEEKPKTSVLGHVAWLILLLLFGGMLVWGAHAIRYKSKTVGLAPTAVAEAVSENAAPPVEATPSTPVPEPMSQVPPKELTTRSEAMNPTSGGMLAAAKEEHAIQKDRNEETLGKELSPPKKAHPPIPAVPDVEPYSIKSNNPPEVFMGGVPGQAPPQQPAPERIITVDAQVPKVVRKSGDVLQNTAVIRQNPAYPKAARAAGVKGTVTVEVTIDEEGSAINARPISGPEPLREAAAAAALRWKWTPTKVDRNRAKVVGTITFHFKP
jgi:TonB family protein